MKIKEQIDNIHGAADGQADILRLAFLWVVQEIRNDLFDNSAVEATLQGTVESITEATQIAKMNDLLFGIGMDKNAYIFSHEVQNLFSVGAVTAIANLPIATQKKISFDPLGVRAIARMREDGAKMAVDLTESSKAGVRAAIIRTMAENSNPTQQLKEIRQLIGLTEEQVNAVLNFRRQLEARQSMGFTPADERRLDAVEQAMVRRHMREGTMSTTQIDDMVERYYQSMLNKRAWDIAHTESLNAVNNGQLELWEQGLDQGIFDDNVNRKFWIVTRDERLRPTHAAIPLMNPNGVKIRSQFVTPFGVVNGPGDRNPGLINCRCVVVLGEFGQQYHTDGYIQ